MIQLGGSWLTAGNIEQYQSQLQAWGMSLSDSGDILIYGCDVAAGPKGQAFIDTVARLTGADVAASMDKTGDLSRSGDWDLEYVASVNPSPPTPLPLSGARGDELHLFPSTSGRGAGGEGGVIETRIAFGVSIQSTYGGLLATYTVTNTNDSGAGSLRQAIIDANTNAGADTIVFQIAGTGVHTIALTSPLPTFTEQVTIDATTDDSYTYTGNTPAIILVGSTLDASTDSIVRGIEFQASETYLQNSASEGTGSDSIAYTVTSGELISYNKDSYFVASFDHLLKVDFVGASLVDPIAQQAGNVASLLDTTSDTYRNVLYTDLWSGVDAVFESDASTLLKSTYYVDAGVSVDEIHLEYNHDLSIDEQGNLVMHFDRGTMTESAPVAWQDIDGVRYYVDVEFRLIDNNEVGFVVGDYNHAYQLVIDPTLTWSTFVGGSGNDFVRDIAVDSSGNVYVTGDSSATWGTPINAFSTTTEAFVAKFNSSGSLVWNTFLGGSGNSEAGTAITLDASGNVFVTGWSNATWGTPVTGYGGGSFDAFVAKLNTSGALQWNTFAGGSGIDAAYGVVLDSSGSIYIAGNSSATWGSPVAAYSSGEDGFVAKFSSTGSLTWNTFVGGSGNDRAEDLAIDANNNIYGVGYSNATWGTPVRAYTSGQDATAFNLTSAGALSWNTFLGGSGTDYLGRIAIDSSGNSYLSGYSGATWGTPVAAYTAGNDGSVVKLNSTGALQWNTFIGGSGADVTNGITLDSNSNVVVTGVASTTFGTPWRSYTSGQDVFVAYLNTNGALGAVGFYGGTGSDVGFAVTSDTSGNTYVAGYSNATWGTPITAYSTGYDGFAMKIASLTSVVTNTNDSGVGSLRQAMADANGITGTDTIQFNIATSDPGYNQNGLGTFVIQPTSALPTITEAAIIDATTQSQYISSPVIELDGSNAGYGTNGFNVTGGGSTIKGFAINGYGSGNGIYVATGGLNNIDANYIGLRPTGGDAVEGAISWFQGEGNANNGAGGSNGTVNGGTTYISGVVGQAYKFNGTNAYVSATVQMTPSFTTSLWAKSDTATWNDYGWIASNRAANGFIIHTDPGSKQVSLYVVNSSGTYVGVGSVAPSDITQWHQYALSYDATTSTARIYLDGALVSTQVVSIARTSGSTTLYLGSDGGTSRFGQGAVDDAVVLSRVLSDTEIQSIYSNGLAGKSAAKIPMVSHWQAEGDAADSRGINNGTFGGNTTATVAGMIGTAFSFDGTDDYVQLANENNFDFANNTATVSGWFKSSLSGATQYIVGKGNTGDYQYGVYISSGNQLYGGMFTAGGGHLYTKSSTATVADGRWHHFAMSFDTNTATEDVKLYLDGIEQATVFADTRVANNYLTTGTSSVRIGGNADGNFDFNGQIDEVAFSNRTLSATEVANLYRSQSRDSNTFVATPVASYKAEGNANDFHGTNEGTLSNGATTTVGISGNAFSFDGVNDYVNIPDSASLDLTDRVTLSAWINPSTMTFADGFGAILTKGAWVTDYLRNYGMFVADDGSLLLTYTDGSFNDFGVVSSVGLVSANKWSHVTGVIDTVAGTMQLYLNGTLVGSGSSGGSMLANNHAVSLGAEEAGTHFRFAGRIDEAAIYNRALNASEVTQMFAAINQSTVGNSVGIQLYQTAGNEIGGSTTAERNIISGNTNSGIYVVGDGKPKDAVSWWKADGNTNDSVGSTTGTLTNGAQIVAGGMSGSSFLFDGNDDYVQFGSSSTFQMANALTMEAWIKPTGAGTSNAIIFNKEGEYEVSRLDTTGEIQWAIANTSGAWSWVGTGYIAPLNTWSHIAIAFDNGSVKTFANGVLVHTGSIASSTIGDVNGAQNDLRIGGRQTHASGANFQGFIDDAAVYRRALSSAEIAAIVRSAGGAKGGSFIQGNYIGTDVTGTKAIGNYDGIYIDSSAGNLIGGTGAGQGNVISGNNRIGLYVGTNNESVGTAKGNLIQANFVGTDYTGSTSLGTQQYGIYVTVAPANTIGGTTASARNIISGNAFYGITMIGALSENNLIQGNYIGTNAAGTAAVGNFNGIGIFAGATNNTFGGTIAGSANIISGNTNDGIAMQNAGVMNDTVGQWNGESNANDNILSNNGTWTGTEAYTTGKLGNAMSFNGSSYVTLPNEAIYDFAGLVFSVEGWFRTSTTGVRQMIVTKGTTANYQWNIEVQSTNVLSVGFNSATTIVYKKESTQTVTDGQWHHFAAVFDTRTASENLTVYLDGVTQTTVLSDSRTTIDYNSAGSQPVLIGARGDGFNFTGAIDEVSILGRSLTAEEVRQIYITGGQSKYGNIFYGNTIGRNAANTADLGNGLAGIEAYNSSNNIFGGTGAGQANIIRGNASAGVTIHGVGQVANQVAYWKADTNTN
jgi:hypothetical protein